MKSVEGKAWPNASRGVESDIQPAISTILEAAEEFGKPYGMGYYNMVLRGVEQTQFIQGGHESLKSFGALKDLSRDEICRLFHYAVDEGWLAPKDDSFNTFLITEKGREFLDQPTAILVHNSYLNVTKRETFFYKKLRAFRKDIAAKHNCREYEVFNDYCMDRMVMKAPATAEQLSKMPGWNNYKMDTFATDTLELFHVMEKDYADIARRRQAYFNAKPDHQYVKRQVEEQASFDQISKGLSYDYYKLEWILQDLGEAHEADIVGWIEGLVNAKVLFRASEFFRKAKSNNINAAREALRMELPVLHMSRLYTKLITKNQEPIAQAG